MEKFLKYKNRIIVAFSLILVLIFSVFIFSKFFFENSFRAKIDFSENIGKYGIIKDELYIFSSKNLIRYSKSGKLKATKEFKNSGNIKTGNDVIYVLNGKELSILNNSFDEVKKVKIEGENLDFFVEGNRAVVTGDNIIKIFDSTLNLIYDEKTSGNVIYAKFSKDSNIFMYIDYTENSENFKSRYNVVNLKDKKFVNGFTLFNELILDAGFLSESSDEIYVVTTEKVYTFKGSTIKGTYYITDLKDFKVSYGKIYLLSDKVLVLNGKDLKVERSIDVDKSYTKINILNSDVVLSKNSGYLVINNKNEQKVYNEEILDVVQNKDGLYFVLQDGFMKLK